MQQKTILIYGLNPAQKLTLGLLSQQAGIRLKTLTDREIMHPIGALLSGKDLPDMPAFPLTGKYALLDGFQGQEQIGTDLINQVVPGVIKAVRTRHNESWRFCDLCSEIQLEHRTMTGQNG